MLPEEISGPGDLFVLIVEANAKDALFLKELLESQRNPSIHAVISESPDSALLHCDKFLPSLIIANLDFFDAKPRWEEFRRRTGTVPVLGLCSGTQDVMPRILEMGFSGSIRKNLLDAENLVQLLAAVARGHRLEALCSDLQEKNSVLRGSVSEGIVEVDASGRVLQVNPAACRMFARNAKESVGQPLGSFFFQGGDKASASAFHERLHAVLASAQIYAEDRVQLRDKNGNSFTVRITALPYQFQGKLSGALIFLGEISDQLKVEDKLKDAIQEQLKNEHKLVETLEELKNLNSRLKETQEQLIQAEKMQSVGRLAAGVAHEVKNPLAILLQGIEFLELKLNTKEAEPLTVLGDMVDAVRRADAVIKGLLDYAAPVEPTMTPEDLNLVMEESLHLVNPLLRQNQIKITRHYHQGLARIDLDRNRMMQVFVNLFSNAIHAMSGGGELIVSSRALEPDSSQGHRVMIIIEDTGTGIPEEILDKIFDPFMTTRRGLGGTGLGLSVVRSIVEMHQGQITIENRKKSGARVTLKF